MHHDINEEPLFALNSGKRGHIAQNIVTPLTSEVLQSKPKTWETFQLRHCSILLCKYNAIDRRLQSPKYPVTLRFTRHPRARSIPLFHPDNRARCKICESMGRLKP